MQIFSTFVEKHPELWMKSYLSSRLERFVSDGAKPRRVWVSIADHYEPLGRGASIGEGLACVSDWRRRWARIADQVPRDSLGCRPVYTFFYPQEEYQHEVVEGIAEIVRLGIGDVDVHLHHAHETRDRFIAKVEEFLDRLTNDHGLLREMNGRTVFGFIHGNWALDNSLPEGRHCGLDGELALLRELGCYADFTQPAAPSPAQSRIVNQIYFCRPFTDGRRSFDYRIPARAAHGLEDGLMMITGPFAMRYRGRLLPRVDTGELAYYDMPTPYRVRRWFDVAPRIGEDIFIKLYSHGGYGPNREALLGSGLENLYSMLAEEAGRLNIETRWVSAWDMYSAAKALLEPSHQTLGESRA